jgi:hypothetical protein
VTTAIATLVSIDKLTISLPLSWQPRRPVFYIRFEFQDTYGCGQSGEVLTPASCESMAIFDVRLDERSPPSSRTREPKNSDCAIYRWAIYAALRAFASGGLGKLREGAE